MAPPEIGRSQGVQERPGLIPAQHILAQFSAVGWQELRDLRPEQAQQVAARQEPERSDGWIGELKQR